MEPISVLLVQDDEESARDIEYQLADIGHNVIRIGASGGETLLSSPEIQADLVILDADIRDDILSIDRVVCKLHENNTPVVVITGLAGPDAALPGLDSYTCLPRPVRRESLDRAIHAALLRSFGQSASPDKKHKIIDADFPPGRGLPESLPGPLRILNNLSQMVLVMDTGGIILGMNHGISGAAIPSIGLSCRNLLNLGEKCSVNCPCRKAMVDGSVHEGEVRSEDGQWYRIRSIPMMDADGECTGITDIIDNITEEKMAHRALSENQRRLDILLKKGSLGFWDWDIPTGHVIYNNRWAAITGMSPDDIDPEIDTWLSRIHPDDRDEVLRALNEYIDGTGHHFESEHRLLSVSGQWKWIMVNGTVMERESSGKAVRMAGTVFDITRRKKAEEEVNRLNNELEKRVEERTRRLEMVNRELNEFAHVVSHDLKAPLRGITQLAGWLKEDYWHVLDGEGREHLDLIRDRTGKMDRLIDGILQYSRAGREGEREEWIDLNVLVRDIFDIIMPREHISIVIGNRLPTILAGRVRMEQIFQNLLSNAVRHMDKEDGAVTVTSTDQGFWYEFCVSDNGPGIDPRYHERIFNMFQTLSRSGMTDSTGIGLSLVKKVVELTGGEIWVQSEVGYGSSFYFTIPKK